MNQTEFDKWNDRAMLLFDDVKRFVTSRQSDAAKLLSEWQKVLEPIPAGAANDVLDRMLDGSIVRVDYFDMGRFPSIVLFEAREIQAARKRVEQSHPEADERRYDCPDCLDAGLVNVWNPLFVEAFRTRFASVQRVVVDRDQMAKKRFDNLRFGAGFLSPDRFDPEREIEIFREEPASWYGEAYSWWRSQGKGPMVFLCSCPCNGERSRQLLAERCQYIDKKRQAGVKQLTAPVCGMADYNARVMPKKTPDAWNDLSDWYEAHEVNSSFEWSP